MRRFETTEEVLTRFSPIGVNVARKITKIDPRFPQPLIGRKGSRNIYSVASIEAYFDAVEKDGFPADVRQAIEGGDQ